jgi:hypothetical protein
MVILLLQRLKRKRRGNGNDCRTKGRGWGSLTVPAAMMRREGHLHAVDQ